LAYNGDDFVQAAGSLELCQIFRIEDCAPVPASLPVLLGVALGVQNAVLGPMHGRDRTRISTLRLGFAAGFYFYACLGRGAGS
jgi:hypothetical protein